MPDMDVTVISIGNELLRGRTLNSNFTYICKFVTALGNSVKRGYTVRDEYEEIAYSLNESLAVSDIVITTGGLGPTFDDITVEAIAKALNLELVVDERALEMLKTKLKRQNLELTPYRKKMAVMPRGSEPLYNPEGTAPGLKITHNGKIIIVLPGVPREMEAILQSQKTLLTNPNLSYYEAMERFEGVMESVAAPFVEAEMKRWDGKIFIKSHPIKDADNRFAIDIEVLSYDTSPEQARKNVNEALSRLRQSLREKTY
ncbi:MAG TPA: molybdopterin-binding protein [Thermoplasmataceae archaeon]|nr:competence damage-inducible protein A [Thermoplasmatales archaeon AK]HLH85772.1 molybdopterin-binding protein [Thermoplasmataceae archaeon]